MSFWTTLSGLFGYGRLANPERGQQSDGRGNMGTEADISVSDERALRSSAFWACVRLIVNSGATLPLPLYTRDATGDRQLLAEDHHLAQLLHRRPNGYMNGKEFRMAMWFQRVLWGNAYAHIRRRGDGQVSSILPLKPGSVTVHREDDGIRYEQMTEDGQRTYWNRFGRPRELLHWRGFSPDGVIAMSPVDYARDVLGITVSADRYASKSFAGRPNGVLTTPAILKPDQRRQVRELYSRIGDTAIGNGQWWLLEGGFKYEAINQSPEQLQMTDARRHQVAEIARFFGVPTVMIDGSLANANWPASYEKQVLAFLTFTLRPYLEEFEDKIEESVLPAGIFVEHNVEGLLRADSQARASYLSQMVQNGIMTRNEARRKENLPRMEGADDLTIQINLAPADKLGENDAQQTPPAA